MDEPAGKRPYSVEKVERIAATPELRASRFTLAPGEAIPWHFHSEVTDRFYCLEGTLRIETRAPAGDHMIAAGGDWAVPARTAHRVSNGGSGCCRFLILQGVGRYDYIACGAPGEDAAP